MTQLLISYSLINVGLFNLYKLIIFVLMYFFQVNKKIGIGSTFYFEIRIIFVLKYTLNVIPFSDFSIPNRERILFLFC